jgi:hypothetical protein
VSRTLTYLLAALGLTALGLAAQRYLVGHVVRAAQGELARIAPADSIEFEVVQLSRPLPAATTGPIYAAIRSRTEWAAWWNLSSRIPGLARFSERASPGQSAVRLEMPQDAHFSQYTFLAAESGPKPNSTYGLMFRSVVDEPAGLVVSVLETTGAGDCIMEPTTMYPLAIVRIPRTEKPIRFVTSQADVECRSNRVIHSKSPRVEAASGAFRS